MSVVLWLWSDSNTKNTCKWDSVVQVSSDLRRCACGQRAGPMRKLSSLHLQCLISLPALHAVILLLQLAWDEFGLFYSHDGVWWRDVTELPLQGHLNMAGRKSRGISELKHTWRTNERNDRFQDWIKSSFFLLMSRKAACVDIWAL